MDLLTQMRRRAQLRERAGLRRRLAGRSADDQLIDLAGNDYLGLSRHPDVVAAAQQALAAYGLGATGSRLVRGTTEEHHALEEEFATVLRRERALVYSSGYLANLGVITALRRPGTLFVLDAHVHASLIDGCRLAGATTVTVPHNDVAAISEQLRAHEGQAVVVCESVYSVDGDAAPLPELAEACAQFGAALVIDDAHGLGVVGPNGAAIGLNSAASDPIAPNAAGGSGGGNANSALVIVTATLSKALGAAGGVVCGPRDFIAHLVDTSRPFIFDTGLPPAVAAGARAALRVACADDSRRTVVRQRAISTAALFRKAGFELPEPAGGVLAIRARDANHALAWAARCREGSVAVGCFRPPSTPDQQARLRLTMNAGIDEEAFRAARDYVLAVS